VPAPTNFAEARELCDNGLYGPFFHAMLRQGVALAPGAYEILFTSLAHSDEDLDRTIACAGEAAQIAAKT
jgi:glutamate-1-semialdehyde 2,1-aminomutase